MEKEMKTINLEEILFKHDKYNDISVELESSILSAMKEACEQALELASENAGVEVESKMVNIPNGAKYNTQRMIVNKKSILDTINQIK